MILRVFDAIDSIKILSECFLQSKVLYHILSLSFLALAELEQFEHPLSNFVLFSNDSLRYTVIEIVPAFRLETTLLLLLAKTAQRVIGRRR